MEQIKFEIYYYKTDRRNCHSDGTLYSFDKENQTIRVKFDGLNVGSFFIKKMPKSQYDSCNYAQRNYNIRKIEDHVIVLQVGGSNLHEIAQECSKMKKAFKVAKMFYSGATEEEIRRYIAPWEF